MWGTRAARTFLLAPFLKEHPQFAWQAPLLHDMKAGPWTCSGGPNQIGASVGVGIVGNVGSRELRGTTQE